MEDDMIDITYDQNAEHEPIFGLITAHSGDNITLYVGADTNAHGTYTMQYSVITTGPSVANAQPPAISINSEVNAINVAVPQVEVTTVLRYVLSRTVNGVPKQYVIAYILVNPSTAG